MSALTAATAARAAALATSLTCSALASTMQEAYLKASDTQGWDQLGWSAAVHGDTAVVGSRRSAYVYVRNDGAWSLQAQLVPSNADGGDEFGRSVAIWGDTIVVGAPFEDSSATGVNGDGGNDAAPDSGAAYVFVREGSTWTQQAYLKAWNTDADDWFGMRVAISGDRVAVGAPREDSPSKFDPFSNGAVDAGAAYVFVRTGSTWSQPGYDGYLKADFNYVGAGDRFGEGLAIHADRLVVGAPGEDSASTGVNGNPYNNSATDSGAAYVFERGYEEHWFQEAYLKASNTDAGDAFGYSLSVQGLLSSTLVVGAPNEASAASGVNGDQADNSVQYAGAAYVFKRSGGAWSQRAYLKRAASPEAGDNFGYAVATSDGRVACGAWNYELATPGVVDLFASVSDSWIHSETIEASNAEQGDAFGFSVGLDGTVLVVGAPTESSAATGVNGDENDNSAFYAGAAYAFVVEPGGSEAPKLAYVPGEIFVSWEADCGGGEPEGEVIAFSGFPFIAAVSSGSPGNPPNPCYWSFDWSIGASQQLDAGPTGVLAVGSASCGGYDPLPYSSIARSAASMGVIADASGFVRMTGSLSASSFCGRFESCPSAGASVSWTAPGQPAVEVGGVWVSDGSSAVTFWAEVPVEAGAEYILAWNALSVASGPNFGGSVSGGAGFDIAVTTSSFAAADVNMDGAVEGDDLGLLLAAWGTSTPAADLNGDGIVDGADLGLLLAGWTG